MTSPVILVGAGAFYLATGLALLGAGGVALYLVTVAFIERKELLK